jgi:uroporphyrinogen-III synthase
LHELGVEAVITPSSGSDSEALLTHPALQPVAGQPIILFRGVGESGGRQLLSETLTARGAEVIVAECYRRLKPAIPKQQIAATVTALREGRIRATHVMSVETLDNLVGLLGDSGSVLLRGIRLIVPHERVAKAARERGFEQVSVSGLADNELIEALHREHE